MYGDSGLLDVIYRRAELRARGRTKQGCDTHPLDRWAAVLNNLTANPGPLIKGVVETPNGRKMRIFWLPEHAPSWALKAAKRDQA